VLGVEACANGVDDDGDTLADCADPDCAMDVDCPAACGEDSRFAVVRCRVAALAARTDVLTDSEPFSSTAGQVLAEAAASASDAEVACGGGDRKGARRGLKRLGKRAVKYGKKVRSKPGRQAIVEELLRRGLMDDAHAIRGLAKGLRRAVICPAGP
jgi:hypothetical protein